MVAVSEAEGAVPVAGRAISVADIVILIFVACELFL